MKGILECCVDSVESAIAAKNGGADRLELCQGLVIGGVTPGTALFQEIKNQMDIRIHALMRPRFGDFCYTRHEIDILCGDIRTFRKLGADAVVIGALKPDGTLDVEAMKRMIDAAGDMSITLHRAFDVCRDPFEALETAKELGVNTILTSGQRKSAKEGVEILKQLALKADGKVDIMAGAGIDADAIRYLAPKTGITTFHMSGKMTLDSRMVYRKEGINMGLPSMSEFEIWRTDEKKVEEAREVLDRVAEKERKRYVKEDADGAILLEALKKEPDLISRQIIHTLLKEISGKQKNFTRIHIEAVQQLWKQKVGARRDLPYEMQARRTYDGILLGQKKEKTSNTGKNEAIPVTVQSSQSESFQAGDLILTVSLISRDFGKIQEKKYTKWFDCDKINCELTVRTRRSGDYMAVSQSGGHKKLTRCMIDDKIPGELRGKLPLVVDGNEVLWIVGGRINERYKITSETGRVLEITYQGGNVQ